MNIQSTVDYNLKIIIVGDSGVGKSNFLFRFVNGRYNQIYQPTIGVDYQSKIIILPKSKHKIQIQFWDTAGQEKYRSISKIYFQRVQGIILMYDITKRESYEGLDNWTKLIYNTVDDVPIALVGNKLDDEKENRIVRVEEGKSYADENGFLFFEASALSGKNVNLVVYSLCQKIITYIDKNMSLNVNTSMSLNDIFKEDKYKTKKEKNVSWC